MWLVYLGQLGEQYDSSFSISGLVWRTAANIVKYYQAIAEH